MSQVNPISTNSPVATTPISDQPQQTALTAFEAFMTALQTAEADPTDSNIEVLMRAGAALTSAMNALNNDGNDADQAMYNNFESIMCPSDQGGPGTLFTNLLNDLASGNMNNISNDLTAFEGDESFNFSQIISNSTIFESQYSS